MVIFFAQIKIFHMLITGKKKFCGVFEWNIAQIGHSNEKIAERTSLFFSFKG